MAGPLQAADDMVRIIANGLTFGLADKLAGAMGEKDTAAKTAAARDRAGVAGDIGTVLGYGGGAKLAFQGIKQVPKIAKAAFSKKGALAGGLGLVGLSEYNARTNNSAAKAQPAAKPAAAKAPAAKKGEPDVDALAAKIAGALQQPATDDTPATFDQMVSNLIAEQGGISLRQLAALGEAARSGAAADSSRQGKAPKPGNASAAMLEEIAVAQFQKDWNDPNLPPEEKLKSLEDFRERTLELNKSQFIDPYGVRDAQ